MKHKIKGDIISWNSSIYDFNYKMRSIKEDEDIELEINSYGGDVFMGIDIMNTLRGHKGNVTVTITGIAASAASVIVMGADVIRAYSNTQLMLHNAWTYAMGNAKKLRKVADDLESINESVLASYTHRIDASTAKKLLDNETYLSATKALESGLIDEIVDSVPEEVESTIFENKAKEFNNKIVVLQGNQNPQSTSALTDEQMQKIIDSVTNNLKANIEPPSNEPPIPAVAQKRKGFIF
ncbi:MULTISPECIES: head maturation protease, ClpP-related [unclassified Niallia]|uniref:head maturation protease, ClpP-related n=1 Tax=unclassified Niallia TaxID=2837522 RepID=UPI00203F8565|nr:head maturation protease, ClpP-related [Niallia sp. MER 6]MCM3030380.1 Clp protease ClpP [Niallia sp. MER 6]